MTSACIFKDTMRKHTQVFLKFRDSVFEICLHLIHSNFTPYFLTSSTPSSDARTSKEIPPDENELPLPAKLITFQFQFPQFSCFDKEDLFSLFLKFQTWAPTCQPNRLTPMYSMWNSRPTTKVYPDQTRRLSSTPQISQAMIPEK